MRSIDSMMVLALVQLLALGAAPANPQLAGVNNGWVGALGLFCDVNRDAHGNPGSWLPPKVRCTCRLALHHDDAREWSQWSGWSLVA